MGVLWLRHGFHTMLGGLLPIGGPGAWGHRGERGGHVGALVGWPGLVQPAPGAFAITGGVRGAQSEVLHGLVHAGSNWEGFYRLRLKYVMKGVGGCGGGILFHRL